MSELKECKECGWTKVVGDFTYRKGRGTYHAKCKDCEATRKRIAYAKDPEKERLRSRVKHHSNREYNKKRCLDYYYTNKERLNARRTI